MSDIPWWVEESYETYINPTSVASPWNQVEDVSYEAYTRPVSVHYPPRVHVFYMVDALQEDGEWKELSGIHYSEELADNAAKKRAYSDGVPHRVRIVVSYE